MLAHAPVRQPLRVGNADALQLLLGSTYLCSRPGNSSRLGGWEAETRRSQGSNSPIQGPSRPRPSRPRPQTPMEGHDHTLSYNTTPSKPRPQACPEGHTPQRLGHAHGLTSRHKLPPLSEVTATQGGHRLASLQDQLPHKSDPAVHGLSHAVFSGPASHAVAHTNS